MDDWKKLNRFLQICLDIAEWYDRKGEEERNFFGNEMTKSIGLGYKAMTGYLRTGVKEVIDIQSKYHTAQEKAYYAKSNEKDKRNFLIEIFGEEEPETLNDEIKAKIKNAVHEILKAEGYE